MACVYCMLARIGTLTRVFTVSHTEVWLTKICALYRRTLSFPCPESSLRFSASKPTVSGPSIVILASWQRRQAIARRHPASRSIGSSSDRTRARVVYVVPSSNVYSQNPRISVTTRILLRLDGSPRCRLAEYARHRVLEIWPSGRTDRGTDAGWFRPISGA